MGFCLEERQKYTVSKGGSFGPCNREMDCEHVSLVPMKFYSLHAECYLTICIERLSRF